MALIETSFPRGGKIEKSSGLNGESKNPFLFGARQEKRNKKNKKHDNNSTAITTKDDEIFETKNLPQNVEAFSAELLNYKTVQEGMILMGKVRKIDDISIKIALPGRMSGTVLASSISESYNKILKKFIGSTDKISNYKKIDEMYSVGQDVYCRVMEIKNNGNRIELILSLKPIDCHYSLIHKNIRTGSIFMGAIEEIQDHGLIIETGIKNLRCFIPIDDASSVEYGVGELICLKITKVTQANEVSTAIGKILLNEKERKIKDLSDPNLDYLLPTSIVKFTITKILKDGLKGTIMNDSFTCYVNEHQLSEPFSKLKEYNINSTVSAKILYIMPLTKLVYLTLNLNYKQGEKEFKRGDIIENAVVHSHGSGGIIFTLSDKYKGVLSYKKIKLNFIGNYDENEIFNKYKPNSKHKIRILDYDLLGAMYICTDHRKVLNEKFYTLDDCKTGEIVTAVVKTKYQEQQALFVQLGNCHGIIEKMYMSSHFFATVQIGNKIRCRILATNSERNIVYLTNRLEYMAKNPSILLNIKDAKENKIFLGTIVKCCERFFIIKFFNNIKGVLYKNRITGFMSAEMFAFHEGQTMLFKVVQNEKTLILDLVSNSHKIGEIFEAKVLQVLQTGCEIELDDNNENESHQSKGFVPIRLISEFSDLVALKLRTFTPGQKISVGCTVKTIFSIRDVEYFKQVPIRSFQSLQSGDIIRCFIKNVKDDIVELLLPVRGYNKLLRVHLQMFLTACVESPNVVVCPDQIVYVKILSKESITNSLTVSARLTDIWNGDFKQTSEIFAKYLDEINDIRQYLKTIGNSISDLQLGEKVSGKLTVQIKESNDWYVELENGKQGLLKSNLIEKSELAKFEEGFEINLIILWIDYQNELIYCSNKKNDFEKISIGSTMQTNYINKSAVQAKVLLRLENVIVCSLKKGKNPLVLVPTKLHYNDFENIILKNLHEDEFCRLTFIHNKWPIAILDEVKKVWIDVQSRKRKMNDEIETIKKNKNAKKMKQHILLNKPKEVEYPDENSDLESEKDLNLLFDQIQAMDQNSATSKKLKKEKTENESNNKKLKKTLTQNKISAEVDENQSEELDSDSEGETSNNETEESKILDSKQKQQKEDKIQKETKTFLINATKENQNVKFTTKPVLPGATNFWSNNLETLKLRESESSSEDDAEDTEQPLKKKKRLTASERFQTEKMEEARLRQIEEKLADPNIQPETADQFDRLVLSEPNNSKHWINYMVFHLQSTEIDKARSIARKALKLISFREEQELLNIWIALLNLELRYGNNDNYNEVLKESLLYNEPLKIYTRVMEILTDTNKIQELTELINIVTKKYKENPDVWKKSADSYFQIGLKDKATQLLSRSLKVLPDRDHVNTIVAFANLNHKYDEIETAHTLLEQIITSYPKRVDVWCQYIDMLLKDNEIESARRTLERAVIQKIPIKKMRTIFKKYVEFEERFGTKENVLKIKEMAENYVKTQVNE